MRKTNKKGFTIVELVIVIAVVAILAAVLIPTFVNVVNKANVSNDTALVKNINITLAAEEITDGKPATMHDALVMAERGGFDVSKLTPRSSGDIVWDSATNRFALVDKDGNKVFSENDKDIPQNASVWKIVDNASAATANTEYSSYIKGNATIDTLTVTNGVDVGENIVNELTYENTTGTAKTVTIRTNGGNLTVNALSDTVSHFGKADKITITAVAPHSYHEYGEVVGDIVITKGRIELAATAQVGTVLVASVATGDVKVDVVSGAQVGTVAPTTDNAKEDIKTSTTIPAESKFEGEGTVTVNDNFAGGLGTERSPYLIANGTHFANINNLSSEILGGKTFYFKQVADIVIDGWVENFAGEYDGNNYKLTYDSKSQRGCDYIFVRMKGHSEFRNINVVMGKVAVALLKEADWGTAYGATFENLSFASTSAYAYANTPNFGFVVVEALYTKGEVTPIYNFTNITNNVNLQNAGTCTGFIVGSGPCFNTKTVVNYVNCVNNATISGTSSVGFLYGNSAYLKEIDWSKSSINVADCKNNGTIKGQDKGIVEFAPEYKELNDMYQEEAGGLFLKGNYLNGKDISIKQDNNKFTIVTDDSNVGYIEYKLAFNVDAIYTFKKEGQWNAEDTKLIEDKDKGSEAWNEVWTVSNGNKFFIDLPIGNQGGNIKTIKAYDKITANEKGITVSEYSNGFAVVVKGDTTYLVFDTTEKVYINCNVSLIVYAYDSNGVILGTKTIK